MSKTTETTEATAKLLILGVGDLTETLDTMAKTKGISALVSQTIPVSEEDRQLIIEICQTQKITHLIFTSLGTQDKKQYSQRIAFFTVLNRTLKHPCPQIEMILITAAECQDIPTAERIFDKVFYDEGQILKEIQRFLESLFDDTND